MAALASDFGISKEEILRELLLRKQASRDLVKFCKRVSDIDAARHHKVMINALERVASGKLNRLMIFMPPGHAKSTYSSVHFPAYYLGVNPRNCIIGASHTQDLAERFSKKARSIVQSNAYHEMYGFGVAQDSRAVAAWEVERGGEFKAAGVGAGIAGRRADVGLIDDPIRSREDAESELVRDRVWEWYLADFRTRLKPNGAIIIIQCMVGDTKVLMSDGSEKDLKDIKIGDEIATYDDGQIGVSKVLNWANQGPDHIHAIRMKSGIIVRANERHPFLVNRSGELLWIRLRDLKKGDVILRATGKEKTAQSKDAMSLLAVKDSVEFITEESNGHLDIEPHQETQKEIVTGISSTDMASPLMNTIECLKSKMENVQYADSYQEKTSERTGVESCVSITAMTQTKSADFYATTATLLSDTERQKQSCLQPLNTYEFTVDEIVDIYPDGYEDVFDIQVENTENFIANGLVSHNTRWHPDDLAGRILPPDYHGQSGKVECVGGEEWEIINFPAICEQDDDVLGRKLGEALWPEYYTLEMLLETKKMQTSRNWCSLYQQRPRPDDANQFDVENLLEDGNPVNYPKFCDSIFAVMDTATKDGAKHDSTSVIYCAYSKHVGIPLTILDYDMVQIEGAIISDWLPSVVERCEDLAKQCGARLGNAGVFIEDRASGAVVIQQGQRNGLPVTAIDIPLTMLGKSERAINVSPYVARGMVKFSEYAYNKRIVYKGRERNQLLFQLTNFRVGFDNKTDDLLDCFTYSVSLALGNAEGF